MRQKAHDREPSGRPRYSLRPPVRLTYQVHARLRAYSYANNVRIYIFKKYHLGVGSGGSDDRYQIDIDVSRFDIAVFGLMG